MKFLIKTIGLGLLIFLSVVFTKFYFFSELPHKNRGIQGLPNNSQIEYLFVGSSMFRKGIDMHILEKNLGDSVYEITYNGNQPISILLEIKALIKKNVKIDNLIVDMYVPALLSNPNLSDKRLIWSLPRTESVKLFEYLNNISDDKFGLFYSYFVQANIQYFFTYPITEPIISKCYYKGGGNSDIKDPSMTNQEALNISIQFFLDMPNEFNKDQLDAILELIDLAKCNNINITFIDTFKFHKISESDKYKRLIKAYDNILKEKGVRSIIFEDLEFSKDYTNFSDTVHLSAKGKRIFSEKLSQKLKSATK